jgi:hypothetical protein
LKEFNFISDVGLLKRNVMAATKPDVIIDKTGDEYSFTTITPLRTLKLTFTPGQPKEFDLLGSEQKGEVRLD